MAGREGGLVRLDFVTPTAIPVKVMAPPWASDMTRRVPNLYRLLPEPAYLAAYAAKALLSAVGDPKGVQLAHYYVGRLLSTIASIKAEVLTWPRALNYFLKNLERADVLVPLAEAAINGTVKEQAYNIIRALLSTFKEEERLKEFGRCMNDDLFFVKLAKALQNP